MGGISRNVPSAQRKVCFAGVYLSIKFVALYFISFTVSGCRLVAISRCIKSVKIMKLNALMDGVQIVPFKAKGLCLL